MTMTITVTSRTKTSKVARELGLELLGSSIGECPAGPCGSAKWRVPEGLLQKISACGDAESGFTYTFEVTSGPHKGRKLEWDTGSAYFQPLLRWAD
jgi:hypothetical protein